MFSDYTTVIIWEELFGHQYLFWLKFQIIIVQDQPSPLFWQCVIGCMQWEDHMLSSETHRENRPNSAVVNQSSLSACVLRACPNRPRTFNWGHPLDSMIISGLYPWSIDHQRTSETSLPTNGAWEHQNYYSKVTSVTDPREVHVHFTM